MSLSSYKNFFSCFISIISFKLPIFLTSLLIGVTFLSNSNSTRCSGLGSLVINFVLKISLSVPNQSF